jgi:pimeloyl-ACP methyl ester carboxylesterase
MRSLYSVALAAVALALSGCLSDASDPDRPPKGTGDAVPDLPLASATFRAQFDPLKGIVPYPNDITGWSGSTDGTLNLPPAATALQLAAAAVNELDGFSIFSRIQANFTRGVAPASLRPDTVFLLEVAVDPATKAVVGLADSTICKIRPDLAATCAGLGFPAPTGNPFLVQGVDYTVSVAPDVDAGGQTVQLVPRKPLNPIRNNALTPGSHNGYLMILTNGIRDTSGTRAQPDATYAQIRGAYQAGLIPLPPPPGLPADQLLAVFIATHLAVVDGLAAAGAPVSVANVVLTASFTPQDTTTVMQTVAGLEILRDRPSQVAQAIVPVEITLPGVGTIPAGAPLTTGMLKAAAGLPQAAISNNGNIYVGGINIPYFQQTPTEASGGRNILASKWAAAAGSNILGDPNSTVISRWNPVPVKRADVTIPMMIAIPNANSAWVSAAQGQGVPVPLPTGWPVVVYQHGFTRNRTDMVLVAEPWLDQGYAVIAIDLPLHGVTATNPAQSPLALLRVPGTTERTFDLDLRNNANPGDVRPDGNIDGSGTNFLNPDPNALLTSRDNMRESVVGVLALKRSLRIMDIDGNPLNTDFDTSQVHYVGHSGGGILGGVIAALCGECTTVSMISGGAGIVKLLEDSHPQAFGSILLGLQQGLAARGIQPLGSVYNNVLRDMQHAWNEGDPIGYVHIARNSPVPMFGSLVNTDVAVTPAASLRLIDGLGLPQVKTPGVNVASRGYTRITEGDHSTYISPAASVPATVEMQTQVAVFLGGNPLLEIPGNGQVILIANPAVVETDDPEK